MRRSVKVAHVCLLGSVIVACLGEAARADRALESYQDQRPLDAEHVLRPLLTALERHQVVTSPALILEADAAFLPLPGHPDREITRTKLIDRIDRGINRAAHEAYDDAATILEGVFRDLDNNPALAAAYGDVGRLASRLSAIPDDDELAGPGGSAGPGGRAGVAAVPARWPIFAEVGVLGTSIPFGALLLKAHNDCPVRRAPREGAQ